MKSLINKNDYIDVLNTDYSVLMYYSTIEKNFIPVEDGEEIPEDYVEVPFAYAIEGCAMRNFWAALGHREIDRPCRDGFRSYVRKRGLEALFDEYEADLVLPYMKAWADENDISLNWDNYIVG